MLSKNEEKVLKLIADAHLVSRQELKALLKTDGMKDGEVVDIATRNLIDKKMVTTVNPLGSTCYVITQQGSKFLRDRE